MPDFRRHSLPRSNDESILLTPEWFREHQSDTRGQKRSLPESAESSSLSQDSGQDEPEDGLKIWGYMPGHVYYNLSYADGVVSLAVSRRFMSALTLPGLTAKRTFLRVRQVGWRRGSAACNTSTFHHW